MINLKKSTIECSLLIIFAASLYMTPAVHAQGNPTTTMVDCIPPIVTVDQPTDCTATVTDISGNPTFPGGTVTFQIPGSGLGMLTCNLAPEGGTLSRISSCSINFSITAPGTYDVDAS